jgi:hypothetical protein
MVPKEVQVLSDIMALLERHQVTLVLYTSPEDRLFSESQQNREEVYTAIAEAGKGKVWMDYTLGGELYQAQYENWLNDSHHIYFKRQFTQHFLRHFQERFP